MKKINIWIDKFIQWWKNQNIESVLDLFTNNVEYWETPFIKMSNFDELRNEWEYIKNQENIEIKCDIFSNENDKYTIKWELKYLNKITGINEYFKWVYLLRLNLENKCDYFFHCGESKT